MMSIISIFLLILYINTSYSGKCENNTCSTANIVSDLQFVGDSNECSIWANCNGLIPSGDILFGNACYDDTMVGEDASALVTQALATVCPNLITCNALNGDRVQFIDDPNKLCDCTGLKCIKASCSGSNGEVKPTPTNIAAATLSCSACTCNNGIPNCADQNFQKNMFINNVNSVCGKDCVNFNDVGGFCGCDRVECAPLPSCNSNSADGSIKTNQFLSSTCDVCACDNNELKCAIGIDNNYKDIAYKYCNQFNNFNCNPNQLKEDTSKSCNSCERFYCDTTQCTEDKLKINNIFGCDACKCDNNGGEVCKTAALDGIDYKQYVYDICNPTENYQCNKEDISKTGNDCSCSSHTCVVNNNDSESPSKSPVNAPTNAPIKDNSTPMPVNVCSNNQYTINIFGSKVSVAGDIQTCRGCTCNGDQEDLCIEGIDSLDKYKELIGYACFAGCQALKYVNPNRVINTFPDVVTVYNNCLDGVCDDWECEIRLSGAISYHNIGYISIVLSIIFYLLM